MRLPTDRQNSAIRNHIRAELGTGDGGGGSGLGYTGFASWTITDGSVGLIDSGDFTITCADGAPSKFVDLDGNSSDAGVMTTTSSIVLDPGARNGAAARRRPGGFAAPFAQTAFLIQRIPR